MHSMTDDAESLPANDLDLMKRF